MRHLILPIVIFMLMYGWGMRAATDEVELVRRSLVRISVTVQSPDYREPWTGGRINRGVGTGFVIDGQRIMTNAHVVSNARVLIVEREGDPRRYPASVLFVAHDCDLALVKVENEAFFAGTTPLPIGAVPKLHSTVTAYGFPIGGSRLSVTRGVVSRIEFRQYSHSALDSHLAVQIDAAINPGNSGGPVVQDGQVVGVAFQGLLGGAAQNIGYMIPTPVVNRFLQDVTDGRYDGYVELAVFYTDLTNPDFRAYLNLPDDSIGVLVHDVLRGGSADQVIKVGDILLAIEGHPILSNGHILLDGDDNQMEEIVERKFHGDKVTFELLREGRKQTVEVTLKGAWPFLIFSRRYDLPARYVMFAGLVFQPMERDLIEQLDIGDLDVLYHYDNFVTGGIYLDRPEVVILSSLLPDEINNRLRGFAPSVVDEVNGVKIRSLKELSAVLGQPAESYVITLAGKGRPIVIESGSLAEAQARIRDRYQVERDSYLGED